MNRLAVIIMISAALIFGSFKIGENFAQGNTIKLPKLYEPVQYNLTLKQKEELQGIRHLSGWNMKIVPLAYYKINATVLSKKRYLFGIDADLVPYDLALAWGALAEKKHYSQVVVRQQMRWVTYVLKKECGLDIDYVKGHLANVHIVPKNKEIMQELNKIRRDDKVYMEGYLIKVEGLNIKSNSTYERQSSMARNDTGDGACEVFYVYKLFWTRSPK